jgi:flagellar L-ring protein FlgH
MKRIWLAVLAVAVAMPLPSLAKKKNPKVDMSPLDHYVRDAVQRPAREAAPSPGSIWSGAALLTDLTRDLRASQVDDIVTIVVAEQASAVATGTTKTARSGSASASIPALAGVTRAAGPWANLANASSNVKLDGQGTTSRQTTLTTTLSARVVQVLPNGNLVVEGTKQLQVNSEFQTVTVRGVIRPADVAPDSTVPSNRLAELQLMLNGKGVVGDAVRRPFILSRILLGLLPF